MQMPNPTVRASATALPKSNNHPDAALLALAEKFDVLQSRYLAVSKECEAAEEKMRAVNVPPELIRPQATPS
jgi:hypothetical protein